MPANRRSIPRWLTGEEAEPTWVSIFLFALIGLSLADAIIHVVQVPEGVIVAAVFAALLVVVRLIRKLYPIERDTSEIVSRMRDGTTVQRFDNYDDLYEALKYRLGSAKHGLRLTHIRDDPPERFGHADFYEAVRRWPGEHPSCKVERIIALPNADMRAWAQELREEEKRHPNFHVTVTKRAAGLPVIKHSHHRRPRRLRVRLGPDRAGYGRPVVDWRRRGARLRRVLRSALQQVGTAREGAGGCTWPLLTQWPRTILSSSDASTP